MTTDDDDLLLVEAAGDDDRAFLRDLWLRGWGGLEMRTLGRVHRLEALEAVVAWGGDARVGAATFVVDGARAELVSLNASPPRGGVGTALLTFAADRAAAAGARRLEAVTTNDNLAALRFYQRRALRLAEVLPGAVDAARERKPTIPLLGDDGIAIHDEFRLELPLPRPGGAARNRRLRARVLAVREGAVAAIRRRRTGETYLTLPGGMVEAGETPEAGAARECAEETGLRVSTGREVAPVLRPGAEERYFAADLSGGELKTGDGPEYRAHASYEGSYEPVWLNPARAVACGLRPACLGRALARRAGPPCPSRSR